METLPRIFHLCSLLTESSTRNEIFQHNHHSFHHTIKTTSNQSNAPFNTGSTNRQFTWSPDGLDSPSSWDSSFYASIYSKAFSLSPTAWESSSSTTLLPFSAPSTNHRGSMTVYPCPRATNKNSDPLPDDCPNSNFGSPVRGGVSRVSV